MTNEECFRQHWQWLAETGDSDKINWPWFRNGLIPRNFCFTCKEMDERKNKICPITWIEDQPECEFKSRPCMNLKSLFFQWNKESTKEKRKILKEKQKILAKKKRKILAGLISELEWK